MIRDSKESALSRWSRRKLEADQLTPAVEESIPPEVLTVTGTEEVDTAEKPVLTDADMPDIESLDEDSDYSGFMSAGVSDKLRNLALRKLFQAPEFNIRDGLDEYDEDYTYFEKLGDIVTCDMKHEIEMQELKRREEAEAEAATVEDDELAEVAEIEDDGMEAIEEDELEAELDQQAEIEAEAELESKPKPKQDLDDEQ